MKTKIEYLVNKNTKLTEELFKIEKDSKEFTANSSLFESWKRKFNECLYEESVLEIGENLKMFAQGFKGESLEEDMNKDLADELYNLVKYNSKGLTKANEYRFDDAEDLLGKGDKKGAIEILETILHYHNKDLSKKLYNGLDEFIDKLKKDDSLKEYYDSERNEALERLKSILKSEAELQIEDGFDKLNRKEFEEWVVDKRLPVIQYINLSGVSYIYAYRIYSKAYDDALSSKNGSLKEDMKNQNKWEKLFDEYLELIEFRLEKDKNGKFHLRDLQGANLGDIESDSFDNADEILDRLEVYHIDYIINDIEDALYDKEIEVEGNEFSDLLKYRDELPDYQFDFDVLDMIINHGKDIDLENVYYEDTEENGDWKELGYKQVEDSNGFMTDYTWYCDGNKHVFVFGDKDVYRPEDEDYDWEIEIEDGYEAEAQKEAQEWFDSYNGYADEVDESLKESVEDNLTEKSIIKTPRGDFKLYQGTKEDFDNEEDREDWGKWFEHYPEDRDDVEYTIFHNHKTQSAIAVKTKDVKEEKIKKVEKWWEDVQDWNVRNGSPFMIDNGNPEDEDYFDGMVDAMFDMVRDLKDKDEELYKRGKRLYNKYAKYSKITEDVDRDEYIEWLVNIKGWNREDAEKYADNFYTESKDGKYVYVLTDGKDNIIDQFDNYDDAVEYAKNSDVVEYIEEVYMDEDGEMDWDDAGIAWTRDDLDEGFIAKDENFKEIKKLCDEVGIKTIPELDYFKQERGLGDDCDSYCLIDALKKYRDGLGKDFKLKENINIRESLNKIDNNTYNQFDLRNLYDSQVLSEDKKIEVAKLIRENATAEKIYNFLMEGIINEEEIDIRTIEKDETKRGNAFFHREPNTLEEIKKAKERQLEVDPDAIGEDYRIIKTVTLDKNVDGIRELNRLTKENVDDSTLLKGTSYYDKNVIEFKTPEGRWLVDPMNYDYAVYAAFVDEE